MNVQRTIGTLSRILMWNVNQYDISTEISYFLGWISSFPVTPEMSPLGVFFQEKVIFVFWQKGNIIFAIFLFIYKEKNIFLCIIWERSSFISHIVFSGKKCRLSRYYKWIVQIWLIPVQFFLGRPSL